MRNAKKKPARPRWLKWGVLAACACLAVLLGGLLSPPGDGAPSLGVEGRTYIVSPHQVFFETCPAGFTYRGESKDGCMYYINPAIPEWIYVYQAKADAPRGAYVRYVDERIRGKAFIRYNGRLYIDMYSAPFDEGDRELYDIIQDLYGFRLERDAVADFSLVGETVFEGYDSLPKNSFGSNTLPTPERLYANAQQPEVIFSRTTWYTATAQENGETPHFGFSVYMLCGAADV